jgi:predicted PolB exonuclease-like 3'-5' exonuclease
MASTDTKYLVFDIESVADGDLVSRLRYSGEKLSAAKAIAKYRAELLAENGKDFIPYTFQLPVSLVVAKLGRDLALQDLVALDEQQSRPHEIVKQFWTGWTKHQRPRLVSFNGRGFDIPLLELCAFRYGIAIPDWFAEDARNFDQPRYRYNTAAHFDLHEWLTNSGASRFTGGLSLAANLIGKPGKMDVAGCRERAVEYTVWRRVSSPRGVAPAMPALRLSLVITALLLAVAAPARGADLPAFPGAEGFGTTTQHARGKPVFRVTRLDDVDARQRPESFQGPDKAGGLRWALTAAAAAGGGYIVFDVPGTIQLRRDIEVPANVYIAGQSAPGGGIAVTGGRIVIRGRDVVIRNLRHRGGLGPEGDAFLIDALAANVVLDHVSISFFRDGAVDMIGAKDVTPSTPSPTTSPITACRTCSAPAPTGSRSITATTRTPTCVRRCSSPTPTSRMIPPATASSSSPTTWSTTTASIRPRSWPPTARETRSAISTFRAGTRTAEASHGPPSRGTKTSRSSSRTTSPCRASPTAPATTTT